MTSVESWIPQPRVSESLRGLVNFHQRFFVFINTHLTKKTIESVSSHQDPAMSTAAERTSGPMG